MSQLALRRRNHSLNPALRITASLITRVLTHPLVRSSALGYVYQRVGELIAYRKSLEPAEVARRAVLLAKENAEVAMYAKSKADYLAYLHADELAQAPHRAQARYDALIERLL